MEQSGGAPLAQARGIRPLSQVHWTCSRAFRAPWPHGQSTLGAVMTPEQMADVDWGDTQPPGGIPWTVSGRDPGFVPPDVTDPIRPPPDPADYARDGAMAGQIMTNPYDPDGNTANAGPVYAAEKMWQFHRGGALDAQAHGGSTPDGNYDFGVYNAAQGLSLPETLDLANTYGKNFSDYQNGKFGGTD